MDSNLNKKAEQQLQTSQEKAIKPPLRIVIVGHVDHGKSSLVGRLLNDTGSLPDGKVEQIKKACEKRGMPFEWAFVMDALKTERDQGITIDVSQINFKTPKRNYVLLDAPGHKEFVKNMVTGAASADAAVLVVDAKEGVQEQTKRHGYLLNILGVKQVIVVLNKMDLVDYSEEVYDKVSNDVISYLNSINVNTNNLPIIPISARDGINVNTISDKISWYNKTSIVQALDNFEDRKYQDDLPLRFMVQDIYKFDERRIIAGKVLTGKIKVGDKILFSPSNKSSKVKTIEIWGKENINQISSGYSVGLTLSEQIFVKRGDIVSTYDSKPLLNNSFKASLFWLGKNKLKPGNTYKLKLHTAEYQIQIEKIEKVLDVESLDSANKDYLDKNDIGEVVIRSRSLMALDPNERFVIQEDCTIVGGGLIKVDELLIPKKTIKSTNLKKVDHNVLLEDRERINNHKSGILWLTGLSSSGKSTLAIALEKILFEKGMQAYVLDGDNLRHGLCSDLGFSADDRKENIRRAGEVAHLFAKAGFIVIASFISPYKLDREIVRSINPDKFHEVYVNAGLDTCVKRDVKGLYKKAHSGEIESFTGVSAPYEAPTGAELVIDTDRQSVDESVAELVGYVERVFLKKL